jgi:hypothetical protein
MAITNYAELKTALVNWMKRSDLSSYTDDLVTIGEKWIYRHARTRDMEAALSVTIASGVAGLPSDFIALKNARVSSSPTIPLEIRPPEWIYSQYPTRSGGQVPTFIGVEGSNFVFGPYPSEYTIEGTYYKTLGALSSSAHALFTNNPDLYLFAALAEAEPFLKNDARVPLWVAKRNEILMDVNRQAHESHFGDGMMARVA